MSKEKIDGYIKQAEEEFKQAKENDSAVAAISYSLNGIGLCLLGFLELCRDLEDENG